MNDIERRYVNVMNVIRDKVADVRAVVTKVEAEAREELAAQLPKCECGEVLIAGRCDDERNGYRCEAR